MAKREVLEVTCDRCGRVETQPKADVHAEVEFFMRVHGEEVKYDDLCKRCRESLKNYAAKIRREVKEETKEDNAPEPPVEEPVKKKGLLGLAR